MSSQKSSLIFSEADEYDQFEQTVSYTPCHTFVMQAQSAAISELTRLPGITDAVRDIAISTCYGFQLNKIRKTARTVELVFSSLYHAFIAIDYPVDIEYISAITGIKNKKIIRKALKTYSNGGVEIIPPENFVPFYADRVIAVFDIDIDREQLIQNVRNVITHCRLKLDGSDWIDNSSGNSIAIAALFFYIEKIVGLEINIANFATACYMSNICLTTHYNTLSGYYND